MPDDNEKVILDDRELNKPYGPPPEMRQRIIARMAKGETYESALASETAAAEKEARQ